MKQELGEEEISELIDFVDVLDMEIAFREHFLGSPTIQINGFDIEPSRQNDPSCHSYRLYRTSEGISGIPPKELFRSTIRNKISE